MKNEKVPNSLKILYSALIRVGTKFRVRMCSECNFSTPTFYRKMRAGLPSKKRIPKGYLTNAEKDKACQTAELVARNLVQEVRNLVSSM